MPLDTSSPETRELLDILSAVGKPHFIDIASAPYAVIPDGYSLESLEHTLEQPTRKTGRVEMHTAESFIDYFKMHQMGSSIYATLDPAVFIAVFNDHRLDEPGWRDHRAIYSCPLSTEWDAWKKNDKKPMKQAEFAQFIEDNLPDIVVPTAADMLEISRTLEAKKKINFASGIRLHNGQQELTYEEEIQGTASKGKLQIPETFTIGIPVLDGGAKYGVEARLRYRIDGGNLVMWYDLIRPHKVYEDAVLEVWNTIKKGVGENTPFFHGKP